jgi:hypothetical protein
MLERALIVSLLIVATETLLQDGMLLGFLGRWFEKWPEALHKPLFGCIGCMASIWGVFWYTITSYHFGFDLFEMVIVCIMCITLNFIFYRLR